MSRTITNVVIIGAPRSGTTLLGGILTNAKEAFPMLPECTYATQLIQHYYNILNYSDAQRFFAYALTEKSLSKIYKDAVSAFILNALSHFAEMPCRYLVIKDPELTVFADLIPLFFGNNCKCVCIVRDPRAVISSMLKVYRKKRNYAWKEFCNSSDIDSFLKYIECIFDQRRILKNIYNYYYTAHSSNLYKENRMHIVQYEKIIMHDEEEFQRLEDFLKYKVNRSGFGKVYFEFDKQDPCYSENYGETIQGVKSDFKKIIKKRDLKKIQYTFSGFNSIYKWW